MRQSTVMPEAKKRKDAFTRNGIVMVLLGILASMLSLGAIFMQSFSDTWPFNQDSSLFHYNNNALVFYFFYMVFTLLGGVLCAVTGCFSIILSKQPTPSWGIVAFVCVGVTFCLSAINLILCGLMFFSQVSTSWDQIKDKVTYVGVTVVSLVVTLCTCGTCLLCGMDSYSIIQSSKQGEGDTITPQPVYVTGASLSNPTVPAPSTQAGMTETVYRAPAGGMYTNYNKARALSFGVMFIIIGCLGVIFCVAAIVLNAVTHKYGGTFTMNAIFGIIYMHIFILAGTFSIISTKRSTYCWLMTVVLLAMIAFFLSIWKVYTFGTLLADAVNETSGDLSIDVPIVAVCLSLSILGLILSGFLAYYPARAIDDYTEAAKASGTRRTASTVNLENYDKVSVQGTGAVFLVLSVLTQIFSLLHFLLPAYTYYEPNYPDYFGRPMGMGTTAAVTFAITGGVLFWSVARISHNKIIGALVCGVLSLLGGTSMLVMYSILYILEARQPEYYGLVTPVAIVLTNIVLSVVGILTSIPAIVLPSLVVCCCRENRDNDPRDEKVHPQ